MAEIIRFLKKSLLLAVLFPLRIFPVKRNRVLLHNDLSYNYSDSQKTIAEYLLKEYSDTYEIFFSLRDPQSHQWLLEKKIRPVRFNSFAFFYYAMTAQVFVTNSGGFSYLPLRKSQYVINTWHGGGAYKKCGIQMYGDTPLFRRDLKLAAEKADLFLSSNARFTEVISQDMLIPRSIFWEIGMPRNDGLLHEDTAHRAQIRKRLGIKEDERLILYAPTYRKVDDDYFKDSVAIDYGIDPDRVCAALEKRFGGKWLFAFRLHPCVVNRGNIVRGCLDLSDYEDMQELLCAADAMINDFSSSMWDFMLTGRPSFLFAVDLQHYIDTTDVYTPIDEWPFPKSTNNDELERSILEFDEVKYAADSKRHYESLGGCETGEATKLVCERIYEVCFGGQKGKETVK